MKSFLPLLPVLPVVFALSVSGCTHAQAKSVPDGPPLDVPAAPPRDIATLDADTPAPAAAAPEEPVRSAPARPRPVAPPRVEAPKPEAPAEAPRRADETAKPSPPTTLQTTPSGAEGGQERAIRDTLARASADLARVDYRLLNADARSQYDTAKRFIEQADDAVRGKNLVFAKNLADKAAALAAQLAGR
jgi:hypothetical protein